MTASHNGSDPLVAAASDGIDLTASHGGQAHSIRISSSASLAELQEAVHTVTSVAPSSQKILYKGKAITSLGDSSAALSSFGLQAGSKVFVIGAKDATVSAFVKQGQDIQRRNDATKLRTTVATRKTPAGGKMVMDLNDLRSSGLNAFGSIEVLPHCPHEDIRRERLVKLSKDAAVLECMKSRQWTVGTLSELHPHRDPNLLGLNKNAGEAILLRILTDDLSGLRPYFHTRMVLLHELTHNKHGDHDEQFKTLNSLLNKEVKAFETAQKAGAHRLGGEVGDHYEPEEVLEDMCGSAGPANASSRRRPAGGHVEDESGSWEIEQRRTAMLKAAEKRAKQSHRE